MQSGNQFRVLARVLAQARAEDARGLEELIERLRSEPYLFLRPWAERRDPQPHLRPLDPIGTGDQERGTISHGRSSGSEKAWLALGPSVSPSVELVHQARWAGEAPLLSGSLAHCAAAQLLLSAALARRWWPRLCEGCVRARWTRARAEGFNRGLELEARGLYSAWARGGSLGCPNATLSAMQPWAGSQRGRRAQLQPSSRWARQQPPNQYGICIESQAFNFLRARPAAHELRYLISTMATCRQKAWFRDRARDSGPQSPNHRGSPLHFRLPTRGRRRIGGRPPPAGPPTAQSGATNFNFFLPGGSGLI